MNQVELHYNVPQLMSAIVNAHTEISILGRGTGKTEGILAPKSKTLMESMPRSNGVNVASTFQQLLTRTLPPMIKGWEKMGYKMGVHYLIGQKPPERWRRMWKWQGPYQPPLDFSHTICWWNGSCMQMISQDRIGSSNGLSIDWIIGDEAKLLKEERLKEELFQTNRGLIPAFRDIPQHHGITFTTDMPVGTSGRWLFEYEQHMDVERINRILREEATKMLYIQQLQHAHGREKKFLSEAIAVMNDGLQLDRKDLVFFQEGSTLQNLHGLGIDYIKQLMRDLSPVQFKTSILNQRLYKVEDGFYPDLDEEKHGYFAYDYHVFENIGYEFDKLKELDNTTVDADYDAEMPMHLAGDYNRRICPLVVGQLHDELQQKEIRLINCLYVEDPLKLTDAVSKFTKYYAKHKNKVIYYWYDHTAVAEYANRGSLAEEVINQLEAAGWVVVPMYFGQAIGHERRYGMYGHLLKEDGYYKYILKMNRERCKDVFVSMYQTQATFNKDGFGKDKSKERDPKFPALEAPHIGEAVDMLITGILESKLSIEDVSPKNGGMTLL